MNGNELEEALAEHQSKYKPGAYLEYSEEELTWWVKLLTKRSLHRNVNEKALKDATDAKNYLLMYIDRIKSR